MNHFRVISILLLYAGYLLIAVLHPFELSQDSSYSLTQFFAEFLTRIPRGIEQLGLSDFVINFLFFIPIGILLYYSLTSPKRSRSATIFLVSVCGGILSFLIEPCQIFFSGRYSSIFDTLANILGTTCGVLFAVRYPIRIADLASQFWGKVEKSNVTLCIVLLYGSIPFIFSIVHYPWFNFHNWDAQFPFQLGNEATLDRPWLGKIYLIALYNRALAPDEIAHHFQLGFSPEVVKRRVQNSLIAFYTFDEGTGTTVHDLSNFGPPLNLAFSPRFHIRWLRNSHGIEIGQPAIVQSQGPAKKLFNALSTTHALSIEVWMTPANIKQSGPARIVSFSQDALARNFTLGQEGADIHFRLRTPISGKNGSPMNLKTQDGFLTLETFHIVATYKEGIERLYVNGREHAESLDLATTDLIIGFAARKTPIAQLAYSFFYFFPVSFFFASIFSSRSRSFMTTLFLPVMIGLSLLSIAEIFQAFVFHRAIDLPLISYGILIGVVGAFGGTVFAWEG